MKKMNLVDQSLIKTAIDHAHIEQALVPRVMSNLIKSTQPSEKLLNLDGLTKAILTIPQISRDTEITKAMHPTANLSSACQKITSTQREVRPPRILDDVTRQIAQMCLNRERITAPYQGVHDMIRSQASVFEGLSDRVAELDANKFNFLQFSQAKWAWNVASLGLVNRLNEIGLLDRPEVLSDRLFEAPRIYTEFVRHTTECLAAGPSPGVAARLRGSLNLAERQLLEITSTFCNIVSVPKVDEELLEFRVLRAPFTQQEEILRYEFIEDENDTDALSKGSQTAQTVQQARRVTNRVGECNDAGKTSTLKIEFFKPTTRWMKACCDLPWLSATDQSEFGELIDCLYIIFYEAAGKDNLRFLDQNGGPLTKEDCDLIWCIKHLRNKWLRHDPDHGKEKDIQKSWRQLTEKFRWLGLAEHPTEKRHFQLLHQKLLELSGDFLSNILNKLELKK